jgi:hypothetical protein
MKNTLAENMLRFGSKNLTEENRKNLKRLTEDYVRGDITYKLNFKDEVAFYDFITPTQKYLDIAVNYEKTQGTEKNNTAGDFYNLFTCLLYAFAYLGKVPANLSGTLMLYYIKNGKTAIDSSTQGTDAATAGTTTKLVTAAKYQDAYEFISTIMKSTGPETEFSRRILDTSRYRVEPPTVTKAMTYIAWFNTAVFAPMMTEKATLYTTTPAPVVAKPVVPVKQN